MFNAFPLGLMPFRLASHRGASPTRADTARELAHRFDSMNGFLELRGQTPEAVTASGEPVTKW